MATKTEQSRLGNWHALAAFAEAMHKFTIIYFALCPLMIKGNPAESLCEFFKIKANPNVIHTLDVYLDFVFTFMIGDIATSPTIAKYKAELKQERLEREINQQLGPIFERFKSKYGALDEPYYYEGMIRDIIKDIEGELAAYEEEGNDIDPFEVIKRVLSDYNLKLPGELDLPPEP